MKTSKPEVNSVGRIYGFILIVLMLITIKEAHACTSRSMPYMFNYIYQNETEYSLQFTPVQVSLPIDSLDTVYLDMSQAQYIGTQVLVPAFFNSDDQVFAFDFALRYDYNRLDYDTILTTVAGASLLSNSYLNPNDSTVRFTSSQITAIPNNQQIALVRFNLIGTSALDTSDLFNLVGYLNGDPCAEKIIPPGVTSLSENNLLKSITVFPNPISDQVFIRSEEKVQLEIFDVNGNSIELGLSINAAQEHIVSTVGWPSGNYLMVFSKGHHRWIHRTILSR